MKNKLYTFLTILGLIVLFTGCEKDGETIVMLDNPIAPAFVTFPDMTLVRDNATDTLIFAGTPVDPGFDASATYYIEACLSGNGFADVVVLWSGVNVDEIKIAVGDCQRASKEKVSYRCYYLARLPP